VIDAFPPLGVEGPSAIPPLFLKGRSIIEGNRLEITKSWLTRIITQIDDLATLENFPTQESIRASADLVGGLAAALVEDEALEAFQPGGSSYERASILGEIKSTGAPGIVTLSQSMLALEDAVWGLMVQALRKEDQDLLALVVRLRSVLHAISTSCLEAYYNRASSELDRLAHTDSLTGLFNRRYLIEQLERHTEIFKRYHHPFSILMLDLDNLKALNDTHGHAAGDAALRHIATLMTVSVRDIDICCRYGGDEFIILMPDTEGNVVQVVGDRIKESLHKTKLKVNASLITLHISAGSASCPQEGQESEELLQKADTSLYQNKQQRASASSE
jgi:diguanylate cyclase (GGDEF)-like protein